MPSSPALDAPDLAAVHHHAGIAPALPAHAGDGRPGDDEGRVEVERQRLPPLLHTGLVRGFLEKDTGAAGQCIEPAQLLGRPLGQAGAGRIVQEVLDKHRGLGQALEQQLALLMRLHHRRHLRAVGSERTGGGQTDARTGAGDQGATSLQLGNAADHGHSPR
jgi:hypothetical protein